MTGNREKALALLERVDDIAKRGDEMLTPQQVAWANESIKSLIARANVHAILALTDPKPERAS